MQAQLSPDRDVAEAIRRYLAEDLLLGPSIGTSQPLFASGLVDSTGFMMIVSFLETHFGIAVDGDDLLPENFDTIDSMARLIAGKRATPS